MNPLLRKKIVKPFSKLQNFVPTYFFLQKQILKNQRHY